MIGLVLGNLRFFWRSHLWVVLGAATAAAVLVGAMLVGDSVRLSLRDQALSRVGRVGVALQVHERFFLADLATRLGQDLGRATLAPVLALSGIARDPDNASAGRAGIVEVLGVDQRFFELAPSATARAEPGPGKALINRRLAHQLGVAVGGTILLRVDKPGVLPRELAMASVEETSFAARLEVEAVLDDGEFGRFGLRASQVPPFNLMVSLGWLQQELELDGKANLLLIGGDPEPELLDAANTALRRHLSLGDVEARRRDLPELGLSEILSDRVFLDRALVEAAVAKRQELLGVLTYFVDGLRHGDRSTPYSVVAAVGRVGTPALPGAESPVVQVLRELLPESMAEDGIVLNQWCAEDLGARLGDTVFLDYQVLGPQLSLQRRSKLFKVAAITAITGAAADARLMPAFPGLHDSENCRDWETGFPIDLARIRDKDEKYWDDHRGVPKAFISLATGQAMWRNRYGGLTALRQPITLGDTPPDQPIRRVDAARLGFGFRDVRSEALATGTSATDFGGLFLGLSFFLIVAALLLTALLFVFGVEQRAGEIGMLLAVGFRPAQVRRLFLLEALLLASLGSSIGAVLGLCYTQAVLWGLGSLWQEAVGGTVLAFHVRPTTLLLGTLIAIIVAVGAIALALRRTFGLPAVDLLASRNGIPRQLPGATAGRVSRVLMWLAPLLAVALTAVAGTSAEQVAGAFFGAGALLLVGALASCWRLLVRLGGVPVGGAALPSLASLSRRNAGRRPGRSLLTIAMLASGTFLVVAVQANRLEPPRDATRRDSGTGGFAFFGRSTLPVLRDLDTAAGRLAFGLSAQDLDGVAIVPMRVRPGDDASCLNLSQAQVPTLVGVDPVLLADRQAFAFAAALEAGDASPWQLLARDYGPGVVPAIGDAASVTWALHKGLGDGLSYRDEQGQEFEVRIVATVAGSILQGYLLVADRHLRQRYPSVSGHKMFLVDVPPERAAAVAVTLSRALSDIGLELTSTGERLATFQAVQNTYLLIFQVLGGLGLLLGSVGVGMVVLRNTLERRSELALLSAVGYPRAAVRRLVFLEHVVLLGLGLASGVVAALLAVLPGGAPASPLGMVALVVAVALSGLAWVALASRFATRGGLPGALQES